MLILALGMRPDRIHWWQRSAVAMAKQTQQTYYLGNRDHYNLAQKLLTEVGGLRSTRFRLVVPEIATEISDQFPYPEMAIATHIRQEALQERNAQHPREYTSDFNCWSTERILGLDDCNNQIWLGPLDQSPDHESIAQLIKPTNNPHYRWDNILYWRLGSFNDLHRSVNPQGCLILPHVSLLLFSEEMETLFHGDFVFPLQIAGVMPNWGMLHEELDAYGVVDGILYRLYAWYQD